MATENSKKGFAGIASLVSDVDTTPPPPAPKREQATQPRPQQQLQPQAQPQPQPQPQPTQRHTYQAPPQQPTSSSGGGWAWGIAVVAGIFWLAGNQSDKPRSQPAQKAASSYSQPAQSQAPSMPQESKPPVGQDLVLSTDQIRYCLAEDIRITGAKSVLNNYSAYDVNRFNAMVDDYNSRCSKFRYRRGALESARRDIEPYRNQFYAAGRRRLGN